MKCQVKTCTNTDLVYSGTDAFQLGIPTETFCYPCANTYNRIDTIVRSEKENTPLTPKQQAWIDSGPITVEALKMWLSLTSKEQS
jgi:hypothetical protein